jgi:hypothetical protein
VSLGPITIFDKSALQALNVDEALWFSIFYMANITPLFFVESLADLEKASLKGRSPEQLVGEIAHKTPVVGARPNVHHRKLCVAELLGHEVGIERFPMIAGGREVMTVDGRGLTFDQPPEAEALERWQSGQFLDVERLFARRWRRGLSGLDLGKVYESYRNPPGGRVKNLAAAKTTAEQLVRGDGRRFEMLKFAMVALEVPPVLRQQILGRWKSLGGPPLPEFARYTAHVMTVDLFFNLAIGSDLIGRDRPSNKIDIAYLYYLPFCMVFVSNDHLHERCVPHFLGDDQQFLSGREVKNDLSKLDAYFLRFPEHVRERGVLSFAHNPPVDGDFLVTRLWDRFLPGWRDGLGKDPLLSPEAIEKVRQIAKEMNEAPPIEGAPSVDIQAAKFVRFRSHVPIKMGKWRTVPPEASE